MPTRPIITYAGDERLFEVFRAGLVVGVPQETVEWKRSYGRPPRAVTLRAAFEPFREPPADAVQSYDRLTDSPVLHTYWLECPDVDTYKGSVKDQIQIWFQQLKRLEFQDWLLVLVETAESKKTSSKILPRTTVLDRLKSDFGGKTTERCLSVLDAGRGEGAGPGSAKSGESWQTFLFRLRQALMAAFGRALAKFEEMVRTQREHRNDAQWNFCNYFLLQEQMAFVFESLGLHDEALVQYDELDALFTQFVLNSAVADACGWLESFQRSPTDWSGVCLNGDSRFNGELRVKIERHEMSVIDFRNYLFARQCALLLVALKPAEVARRCLANVQNCQHEMKLLKVDAVEGAVPCWILLTCLQVLATCQSHVHTTGSTNQAMEYFAMLWNVAKDKLYELGRLCGLVPGATVGSQQLHAVATLSTGVVDSHDEDDGQELRRPTPVDKLKEALSSQTAFTKHYLELSELAMGTFKHCGRLRSARLIGRDLSRFYIQLGQPHKAINFLVDLLRGYHDENWQRLKADTHIELARIYQQVGDSERFVEAAAHIAAYPWLDASVRAEFFAYAENYTREGDDRPVKTIAGGEMIGLESVRIEGDAAAGGGAADSPAGVRVLCDGQVRAHLRLVSRFPSDVRCRQLALSLRPLADAVAELRPKKTSTGGEMPPPAQVSNAASPEGRRGAGVGLHFAAGAVEMRETQHLKQDGGLSSVALVCANAQQVLGRKLSSGVAPAALGVDSTAAGVVRERSGPEFTASAVTLRPGVNQVTLSMRAEGEASLALHQLVVALERLELVQPAGPVAAAPALTVVRVTPTVTVVKDRDDLLAGLEQHIQLVIKTGSTPFNQEANLRLSTSWGLSVRLKAADGALQRELDLHLEPMAAFETATFDLVILADLSSLGREPTINHKLMLQCPWLTKQPPLLDLPLHISAPLSASFKLHTASTRKFVNVHVQGLTCATRPFQLHRPAVHLADSNFKNRSLQRLELVSLNDKAAANVLTISQQLPANFLWELCGVPAEDVEPLPPLKVEFSVDFRPTPTDGDERSWSKFSHHFDVNDYSTLFTVRSRVDPVKGNDFLRAGSLCHMTLTVQTVRQSAGGPATALMYEVLADQALWAVCGRTAGVFSMEGASKHSVQLDVMPLLCGFLPLPAVRLSRYIPAEVKTKDGGGRKPDLGGAAPTLPRLEPFSPGQVYNWSKAQQVHVLAAPSNAVNGIGLDSNSLN